MGMEALPTGVWGPLPPGTVGPLLGTSNVTMNGVKVEPSAIDNDYTGEIRIMTHPLTRF